jgi:two-component system response regulator
VGTADFSTRKESELLLAGGGKEANVRGEVILLVEDDADVAELFVVVLGRSGFTNEVVVACDGVETRDYLFGRGEHAGRDNTHTPGLIVLDLNMPRMGGLETLRRMRSYEETKLLPVVVMSASPSPRDKDEAHRLRANSFFGKTTSRIAYSELVPVIARCWLHANEAPFFSSA